MFYIEYNNQGLNLSEACRQVWTECGQNVDRCKQNVDRCKQNVDRCKQNVDSTGLEETGEDLQASFARKEMSEF